jgi:hypothetical protein
VSHSYISKELRRKITEQARRRCGYCLTSELVIGSEMDVEHIIPEAAGGPTDEHNLWLSCAKCNSHKADKTYAIDPETGETVSLFNPRQQSWSEHFAWSQEGDIIIGQTVIGRATIVALQLNRPLLVSARQVWVKAGLHPPQD